MLGRDGTFQIHNGGLRVGSFSNGTTFATGTSEIGAKGNIKTQKVMYAKTNYPVPITVAVGTDNNSRHISISNQGYWQVTGITLPQTGMYALRASIHMNITGQNYHKGYIVATLGNSTVGHYYASNYDDYHVYTSSHIGTLSGCLYKTAGSNVTLKFKFAYTPDGVTYADVRSYHLMYIGPTSQVVD